MSAYQLAQLNVATLKAPLDSPLLADFVANLDPINALAEAAPGFVWRLKTPAGDATALRPLGDDVIVNMSVWQDVASLNAFTYRGDHVTIMRRRREWFRHMDLFMVLWWVPAGHEPDEREAIERLDHLRAHGPTPHAFSFRHAFPPPGQAPLAAPPALGDACTAL